MNCYFLFIGILQLWSIITPVDPLSTWGAIVFIFALSASKEAFDDYNRYKRDKAANERRYWVLRPGSGENVQVMSKEIRVGDIVFLANNEEIPCDLVVLQTSEQHGTCYIQTANLDGETDLKSRIAPQETQALSLSELAQFKGLVECAPPNDDLYVFDSRLSMQAGRTLHASTHADWLPLSFNNMVLQATHLRNTDWIYGLAVYTGNETKIGQSKEIPPCKWTKLDRAINKVTVFVFIMQLTLVVVFGAIGESWRVHNGHKHWYLGYPSNPYWQWYEWIVIPLRFLLLNSTMIPISLKVTMDLVKYAYALIIMWDLQMYHADGDTPAVANNTAISEDLGQIEYLFADKTGTLTENIMLFKKCFINGGVYECADGESEDIRSDAQIVRAVKENSHVREFFTALALCHTVVPTVDAGDSLVYKASSPDEEALVHASAILGIVFTKRDLQSMDISVHGAVQTYDLLHVLEFSSDRKRMSVVVRNQQSQNIILYCKGADDMILERLRAGQDVEDAKLEIENFARKGLRTLCVARRHLSDEQYHNWKQSHDTAKISLEDRTGKLEKAYEVLENELEFLGVTAIEDKLQDNVPSTIETLRAAGVRVWMLTGDKQSTAVQIGISSRLISSEGEILIVKPGRQLEQQLTHLIQQAVAHFSAKKDVTVVVEGSLLKIIMGQENFIHLFFKLAMLAHSVVCCRLTPLQKAQVVKHVKDQGCMTLAIGDGGNDQLMIQEADVGVGIVGREGLQAARAADYSIGRFYFLQRLMLVHGRYSYHRSSFVASYSFYKSLFICFMQILFEFLAVFSGTSYFNSLCLMLYNVVFTGLPVMGYVLDKDLPEQTVMGNPFLYRDCQQSRAFNMWTTMSWFFRAFYQALIVFLFTHWIVTLNPDISYDSQSLVPFTALIIIQTFTIVLESHTMTVLNHLLVWGTLASYFVVITWANAVPRLDMYSAMDHLYSSWLFWWTVIILVVVSLLPIVSLKYYFFNYFPTSTQVISYLCVNGIPFNLPTFFHSKKAEFKEKYINNNTNYKNNRHDNRLSNMFADSEADLIVQMIRYGDGNGNSNVSSSSDSYGNESDITETDRTPLLKGSDKIL